MLIIISIFIQKDFFLIQYSNTVLDNLPLSYTSRVAMLHKSQSNKENSRNLVLNNNSIKKYSAT